jgi:hypothetical protein
MKTRRPRTLSSRIWSSLTCTSYINNYTDTTAYRKAGEPRSLTACALCVSCTPTGFAALAEFGQCRGVTVHIRLFVTGRGRVYLGGRTTHRQGPCWLQHEASSVVQLPPRWLGVKQIHGYISPSYQEVSRILSQRAPLPPMPRLH